MPKKVSYVYKISYRPAGRERWEYHYTRRKTDATNMLRGWLHNWSGEGKITRVSTRSVPANELEEYGIRANPSLPKALPSGKWLKAQAVKVTKKAGKIIRVDILGEPDSKGKAKKANPSKAKASARKKARVSRKRIYRAMKRGWKYKHLKKGWMAYGPRGGKYGPFATKREAMRGRG